MFNSLEIVSSQILQFFSKYFDFFLIWSDNSDISYLSYFSMISDKF